MIRKHFTELTLILVAIIWALNFSVIKVTLTQIDPFSFNALRYVLSAALLIGYAKLKGFSIRVQKQHFWPWVGIGLVGNLLYQVLFIVGLNLTNAAHAAVMLGTIPVWVTVFSHFFTDEKTTRTKVLGILSAFVGVVMIIISESPETNPTENTTLGDVIALISAMSWAAYTILSKKYLKIYHSAQYSGFMALVGVIALVLAGLPSLIKVDFSSITLAGYGGIIYSGLLSVGLSYLIWNRGIHLIGTVKTAAYQNLVPVLGLIFGVIILGEELAVFQYIGSLFVIIGIIIARK